MTCRLRTVVEILKIFEDVFGGACEKDPSYTTIRNRMLKLRLSIYNDDKTREETYAMVLDESVTVNRQKLLLILGIPSEHPGRPLEHSDVTVLDMRVAVRHPEIEDFAKQTAWLHIPDSHAAVLSKDNQLFSH